MAFYSIKRIMQLILATKAWLSEQKQTVSMGQWNSPIANIIKKSKLSPIRDQQQQCAMWLMFFKHSYYTILEPNHVAVILHSLSCRHRLEFKNNAACDVIAVLKRQILI